MSDSMKAIQGYHLIKHRVHALLMGGQPCVFCGAAQFSRDTDLAKPYWLPLRTELQELRHTR